MALKPAGKTLSSLTGIVAMAAILWLLLNFVYAPSCGRFACSFTPSWLPQASADGADACPDSITAAASDAAWAADRIESIKDAKLTTGLSYDPDGTQHTITSGHEDISDRMEELLRSSGKVNFPPGWSPPSHHTRRDQNRHDDARDGSDRRRSGDQQRRRAMPWPLLLSSRAWCRSAGRLHADRMVARKVHTRDICRQGVMT